LFLERQERKSERVRRKVQLGGQRLIFYFKFAYAKQSDEYEPENEEPFKGQKD